MKTVVRPDGSIISGMKGTYIKVLNEVIFDELEEIKAQRSKKA